MLPAKRYFVFIAFLAITALPACSGLGIFTPAPADTGAPETVEDSRPENEPQATPPVEPPVPETPVDTNAKAEKIEALEEKIVLLEDKVKTLENEVAGQKKVVYTIEYSDPAQLYREARTLLLANDIDNAADLFSTFAKKHPAHALADNAMYWLGECHYTKGDYKAAAAVFKALVTTYPKAEKVPDALLKAGYSYLSMDDVNRASHFLRQVITKYPFSPAAEKAQVKLKDFQ